MSLKKITPCIIFLIFSTLAWAQKKETIKPIWTLPSTPNMVAKKLLTYRKFMVSATHNMVLLETSKNIDIKNIDDKKGTIISPVKYPKVSKNAVLSAFEEKIWVADNMKLTAFSLQNGKQVSQSAIPSGSVFSVMTNGFNNTLFLVDNTHKKLYLYANNTFSLLIDEERLAKATALLLINGDLFIGTETGILSFNLRKKELSVFAENTGSILALEKDYLVHIVALTKDNILRFIEKGNKEILLPNDANYQSLSINTSSGKLLLLDNKGTVSGFNYLTLAGISETEWALRQKRKMQIFENNNLQLIGSEYIIHVKNDDPEKREIGLEGFYPEKDKVENGVLGEMTPNEKTMECAEKSYQTFLKWSQKVSPDFKKTIAHGTPPTFWLMVNDYSGIKEPLQNEQRLAKIWYWKRSPAVLGRYPGFWKWEAVLNQKCECELPDEAAAEKFFQDFMSNKTN